MTTLDTKFFQDRALESLYHHNRFDNDGMINVSESSALSLIIEIDKISYASQEEMLQKFNNVSRCINTGEVWIIELDAYRLSQFLNEEELFETYCNQKLNPLTLSKRIALYPDSIHSYWSPNVYMEAFFND